MNGQTRAANCSYTAVVVHRDKAIRASIIQALGRQPGWLVHGVANGTEGVRIALAALPQLILLDPYLPGMDGDATIATLRAHGIACPIVALVQHNRDAPELWKLRGYAGAVEYFAGPPLLMPQLRELLEQG